MRNQWRGKASEYVIRMSQEMDVVIDVLGDTRTRASRYAHITGCSLCQNSMQGYTNATRFHFVSHLRDGEGIRCMSMAHSTMPSAMADQNS